MTPIDDLRVGQYIVVVGVKGEPQEYWFRPPTEYSGLPGKVLAVSLPFVAVLVGEERVALDVRALEVQRVSRQYVKAMAKVLPAGKRKAPPEPGRCVRCGTRLHQVLNRVPRSWMEVCPECGWQGTKVPCE